MRNVGTYIKSWFGRFDAVSYRRPDPWLWIPAAVLLMLGLLMVLNTTYFLGLEKQGDAFHFFKLHLAHIAVGFVLLMILSQFSLAGLRRIALPLFAVSVAMLVLLYVPGLGLVRGGARRWLRLGPIVAEPSELVKFALVLFPRPPAQQKPGADRRFHTRTAAGISDRGTDHDPGSEAAGLRQHGDDRADPVRDAVGGGRALAASCGGRRRSGRHPGVPGGGEVVPHETADDVHGSMVGRARGRLSTGAVVHRTRRRRQVGRRAGRGTAEDVLSAGGAHGFRLRGGRRGIRADRSGGGGGAVPGDPVPGDENRARRARSIREPARGGTDGAALDAGADQHVGGDWPDTDQGPAAAIPELRRHVDHHRDGGAGRATRAGAPAGGAMKVIIAGGGTGGHLFPAVALGEELMRERPDIEVLFAGTSAGLEAKWLPKSGYRYELFELHGIRGHNAIERMRASVEFVRSIGLATSLVRRFRPSIVVSAGGYASASMGAAAILTRTPLVLMGVEHAAGAGESDDGEIRGKDLRRLRRQCGLFWCVEGGGYGESDAVQYQPDRSGAGGEHLQILVLGGSSGAHRLNIGVVGAFKICGKSVINLHVVHQTGEADEELVRSAYREMKFAAEVVPFIDDVADALHRADLVIARSGAMTVTDIALGARAAIFVPYPFHKDMQQLHNARVLEKRGGAIIILDDELLASNLAREIVGLVRNPARLDEMGLRAHQEAHPDAARDVARVCFEIAERAAA